MDLAAITGQFRLNIGAMRRHFSSKEMFPVSQTEGEEGLMFQGHGKYDKVTPGPYMSELIHPNSYLFMFSMIILTDSTDSRR